MINGYVNPTNIDLIYIYVNYQGGGRHDSNKIPTATSHFWGQGIEWTHWEYCATKSGSGKSKMAAAKQQVVISQLVD
jgi:hypothetical protein